jgi:hypothetical protein
MKHVNQDFKAFPYLNLTVGQVVDWFSESIKSKFNALPSERIELDEATLKSGKAKQKTYFYIFFTLLNVLIRSLQDVSEMQARPY